MLISKMQKWDMAKFLPVKTVNQFSLFWEHLSLWQVCIFEIIIKFSIFLPCVTYFQGKKYHLSEGPFFTFLAQTAQNVF
jgi:hypothetical protein